MRAACRHTKRVIALKRSTNTDVAADMVWLGYEYLCRAKRPNPLRPLQVLLWPLFLLRGLRLLTRGVGSACAADRDRLAVLADFYRAELIHSWANLGMLLGNRVVRLMRPVFVSIARQYDRIAAKSDLMEAEYYWMRHLESKLLAGESVDRASTEYLLREIGHGYRIVQNSPQVGNALAYEALMAFLLDGDRRRARHLLSEAEHALSEAGKDLCSGRRRVVLFRRFIGEIGFFEAIRQILCLERDRSTARQPPMCGASDSESSEGRHQTTRIAVETDSDTPGKRECNADTTRASRLIGEGTNRSRTMDVLAHYLHQDNAMWRAVEWAIPIEAGVIAGGFARPGWPGICLVVLGTLLVVAFAMYAWKAWDDMNVNLPVIDREKPDGFRLTHDAPRWRTGRFWLTVAISAVILSNVFQLALHVCKVAGWFPAVTDAFFS